jgi:hypothetical protein
LLLALLLGLAVAVAYHLGKVRFRGGDGFKTVVRCREGHVFRTVWIPLISFKAVRLGAARYPYCPVGRHWTLVTPVDPGDLTPTERLQARQNADSGVP